MKPYYKLKEGTAIAGLKKGEVYYLTKDYKIYEEWDEVELCSLKNIFDNITSVGKIDKPSRKKYSRKTEFYTLHRFNGWEHVHYINADSSDI